MLGSISYNIQKPLVSQSDLSLRVEYPSRSSQAVMEGVDGVAKA